MRFSRLGRDFGSFRQASGCTGWIIGALLIGIVGAACDGAGATGPQPPFSDEITRIAPRLGVMGLAVAVGPQGAGFFDNFLPCVRRGVIVYRNTPLGRAVTFHGCHLGHGIVVDGAESIGAVGAVSYMGSLTPCSMTAPPQSQPPYESYPP